MVRSAVAGLGRDVRYALRGLGRNPVYGAVALASLGLGIGLATATFSVANTLLFQQPPGVLEPDRLVSIGHQNPEGWRSSNSYLHYELYRDQVASFTDVAAHGQRPMYVSVGGALERVSGGLVSADYFATLGVGAALGRTLVPSDGRGPHAFPVVVLSHRFWQSRLGGDPGVLGTDLMIGGHPFTIIGVAAAEFRGLRVDDGADLWIPAPLYSLAVPELAFPVLELWGAHSFSLVARLAPGVSMSTARAELAVAGETAVALEQEQTGHGEAWRPVAETSREARIPSYRREAANRFLLLLVATSVASLLITSLNLANLTAARTVRRRRELAVRLSLGSGRGRLVRQVVMESLLVSLAGGAVGLLVARLAVDYLTGLHQPHQPFGLPLAVDGVLGARVLLFALLLCVLAGLLAALVPAWQSLGLHPMHALKGDHQSIGRGQRLLGRDALIVAQVTLSLILLVPAGLLVRTVQNARAEDLTVEPEQVLVASFEIAASGHAADRVRQVHAELVERAASLPGVTGAALVEVLPMTGRGAMRDIIVGAPDEPSGRREVSVAFNTVTPSYFEVVGLPLVAGRGFTDRDDDAAPLVAVVNERMAARLWPGTDPLGRTFELAKREAGPLTVVGVVRDGKYRSHRAQLASGFYMPYGQAGHTSLFGTDRDMTLQVRTTGRPVAMAAALRRELRDMDPALPLPAVRTMAQQRDAMLASERLAASLLSAAGLLALGLSLLGLYGIIAFMVAQRTAEIGIRMALGARAGPVIRLMLKRSLALTAIGLVLGLVGAGVASRLAAGMLYGVEPLEPTLYVAVGLAVVAVALATAFVPARRAAHIDPTSALRWE